MALERLISCYSGVFEDIFCTEGGEFDHSNFKKYKFPVSAGGGGMLKFQIDIKSTFTSLSYMNRHIHIPTMQLFSNILSSFPHNCCAPQKYSPHKNNTLQYGSLAFIDSLYINTKSWLSNVQYMYLF
jgi:hypothetical protein